MRFAALALVSLSLAGCGAPERGGETESKVENLMLTVETTDGLGQCPSQGAAIQVLGSGGPIAEGPALKGRAGASYLLWIDGTPRLLIDAGAGSFLRFAEAGGRVASLDAILISHLHADHAGDLAGILNTGGFEGRTKPVPIIGPDSAPRFPGMTEFLSRLVGKESGAFAYNGGYLDGTENKPVLQPRDIPTREGAGPPVALNVSDDYSVMAHPVHHGPVPTLGFVVEFEGKSVVLTGDQSFLSERFVTDLTGQKPEILIAHHVINGEPGQPRGLHRTPEQIGELAGAIEPERLILGHNMDRSLSRLKSGLAAIARGYDGPVSVASDLDCYAL
ncbi:MAG: MBL fold metallo-hydrolase [Pseudomonadota bacterium]